MVLLSIKHQLITKILILCAIIFVYISSFAQTKTSKINDDKSTSQKRIKDTTAKKNSLFDLNLKNLKIKTDKVYTEKALPSERLATKKFTRFRRFYQNMVSEFNFYFYARTEYQEFMRQLYQGHIDNFDAEISFRNYNPDFGATLNIDTIIDDATKGILLHDLRSDLADDFYLLIAKTYLYHKNYQDGLEILEFLNYFYAKKNEIGFDIPIGSNETAVNGKFTLTNQDKKHWWDFLKRKPVRNESLLWQVKMLFDMNRTTEAVGLLELIKNDQLFPKYLYPFMNELIAYNFYINDQFDSAANHLVLALPLYKSNYENARYQYLIAQLYEKSKRYDLATIWFKKCAKYVKNKNIYIYALLNYLRLSARFQNKDQTDIIALLNKLLKKSSFENSKDLIYFVLANIYLQQKDTNQYEKMMVLSIKNAAIHPYQLNKSKYFFSQTLMPQNKFLFAKVTLDSFQTDQFKPVDIKKINYWIKYLPEVVNLTQKISFQEKLIQWAPLESSQRLNLIDNWLKSEQANNSKIENTFVEEVFDNEFANSAIASTLQKINSESTEKKGGVFYFNVPNSVTSGSKEFKKIWGNVANTDNWAISSIINLSGSQNNVDNLKDTSKKDSVLIENKPIFKLTNSEINNLFPTNQDELNQVHQVIIKSYLRLADINANFWSNIPKGIEILEYVLNRFDNFPQKERVYWELSQYYLALKNAEKSNYYADLLRKEFPDGQILKNLQLAQQEKNDYKQTQKILQDLESYLDQKEARYVVNEITKLKEKKLDTGQLYVPLNFLLARAAVLTNNDSLAITTLQNILKKKDSVDYKEYVDIFTDIFISRYELEEYLQKKVIVRLPADSLKPKIQLDSTANKIKKLIEQIEAFQKKPEEEKLNLLFDSSKFTDTLVFVLYFVPNIDKGYYKEVNKSLISFNKGFSKKNKLRTVLTNGQGNDPVILVYSFADTIEAKNYLQKLKSGFIKSLSWLPKNSFEIFIIEQDNDNVFHNKENLKNYFEIIKEKYPIFN